MGDHAWTKTIKLIKTAVTPFKPFVAGYLEGKSDLDIFIVLNEKTGRINRFIDCLQSISAMSKDEGFDLLFFRRFEEVPLISKVRKNCHSHLVHLMMYPDISAMLKWEQHFILASFADRFTSWTGNDLLPIEVLNRLRPEDVIFRGEYYRRILYDAVHFGYLGLPDIIIARRVMLHRLRYILRYVIYEAELLKGVSESHALVLSRSREGAISYGLVDAYDCLLGSTKRLSKAKIQNMQVSLDNFICIRLLKQTC